MASHARVLMGLIMLAGGATGALLACSSDDNTNGTTPTTATDAGTDTGKTGPVTTCVDAGAPACSAASCTAQFGGDAGFCIEGTCVQATNADCTRVGGDLTGSNQIVIGAMLQTGAATVGPARANSLELAIKEINAAGGIPGPDSCSAPRTLAFVQCDDTASVPLNQTDYRAGAHLVNDLKVPVIVGGSKSTPTTDIAQNVTVPAKVMLFAPSSTAISLTNPTAFNASPDGTRLLWRTAPSDIGQTAALRKVYALLEQQVITDGKTPKVALVTDSNTYGAGIHDAFVNGFQIQGAAPVVGTNFKDITYTDPTTAPCIGGTVSAAETTLAAFGANIVILVGTDEINNCVLTPLEQSGQHPYYLGSDGIKKDSLITAFNTLDGAIPSSNSLQGRLRGTQPGVVTQALTQNFFNLGYKSAYGASSTLSYGMAGTYDIGYMLAYAIAATKGGAVTGEVLAKNMSLLVGTDQLDVGTANLSKGFTAMLDGKAIDFNGASGPLDFDLTHGEAPSDDSVWCVKRDPNSTDKHIYNEVAGLSFSAKTQALVGTYSCPAQ